MASHNCRREINLAIELKKEMLIAYIEDVELPLGMQLQLGILHAIYRNRHSNDESFINSMAEAKVLQNCLAGAAPSSPVPEVPVFTTPITETPALDPEEVETFNKRLEEAENGDVDAQCSVGYFYEFGKGVETNLEKAVLWYTKAASNGDATATCNLAYCYRNGLGV